MHSEYHIIVNEPSPEKTRPIPRLMGNCDYTQSFLARRLDSAAELPSVLLQNDTLPAIYFEEWSH